MGGWVHKNSFSKVCWQLWSCAGTYPLDCRCWSEESIGTPRTENTTINHFKHRKCLFSSSSSLVLTVLPWVCTGTAPCPCSCSLPWPSAASITASWRLLLKGDSWLTKLWVLWFRVRSTASGLSNGVACSGGQGYWLHAFQLNSLLYGVKIRLSLNCMIETLCYNLIPACFILRLSTWDVSVATT